tara:strand:- start:4523 stop:4681 length:159 start_codon:yes stop_codon:yes gene_type:complete
MNKSESTELEQLVREAYQKELATSPSKGAGNRAWRKVIDLVREYDNEIKTNV